MSSDQTVWRTADGKRYFLLPAELDHVPGLLALSDLAGNRKEVNEDSVRCYEVTEEQAHRWVRQELGDTLTELRTGIDEKLTDARRALEEFKRSPTEPDTGSDQPQLNADASPALLDFLKSLPGVIGQGISGDQQRVDAARDTLTRLQQRLRESGIDVDDRMKGFADRLASIRDSKPEDKS